MNDILRLHVPALSELGYRQRLLADPATMAYNRGYDLSFEGYHPQTGCIDFPESAWAPWHACFIGREPERYYAYILLGEAGVPIGEVNLHRPEGCAHHEMGIVLEARHRGRGYSEAALALLLRQAFEHMDAAEVRNDFEITRAAALKAHLACGFQTLAVEGGVARLRITRQDYLRGPLRPSKRLPD